MGKAGLYGRYDGLAEVARRAIANRHCEVHLTLSGATFQCCLRIYGGERHKERCPSAPGAGDCPDV